MPKTKSAKKALRQSERKKTFNLRRKNAYKLAVKTFRKNLAESNLETAQSLLPKVFQTLDKAAKGKTIKKNKASRLKSRLSKAFAAHTASSAK